MKTLLKPNLYNLTRLLTYIFGPSTMFLVMATTLYCTSVPKSLINGIIWFGSASLFLFLGFIFLLVLRSRNLVSDFNITKRSERPRFFFPLLAILISYTFLNYIWGWNKVGDYLAFITISTGIAFIITTFFKISIHVFASTLAVLVIYISTNNLMSFMLLIIPLLTGWTRLYLKKHKTDEVIAGFFLPIFLLLVWKIFY